jgi:predicted GIY-YIG superfamily endonuclease
MIDKIETVFFYITTDNYITKMSCLIIYALQLEQGKFYVGKTHRQKGVEMRFKEHLTGRGSEWTKKYHPISIIESYEHHCTFEEDILTKKYMMEYGIEHVRGGSYTKIELEEWQVKSLEHEFKSASDKCFKCGKTGHFAKDCEKGMFLEYLCRFETEEEIEEEIARLENFVIKVNELHSRIDSYKFVQIVIDKREKITIEIEPSIIDTYDMRYLVWNKTQINSNSKVIINEKIYSYLLRYKEGANYPNIIDDQNVVQNIYKVYIYRKKLERQYVDILRNEGLYNNTLDETIKIINTKIELLYEKLATLF